MSALARITAIVFILIGLLIVLIGAWFAVAGIRVSNPSPSNPLFDMSGPLVLARLVGGIAIGMQGLFLVAIGEGLWLLAGVHDQTGHTADLLSRLTRKSQ